MLHPCANDFALRASAALAAAELELEDREGWENEALELVIGELVAGHVRAYQATVLVAARRGEAHGATSSPLELAEALHAAILDAVEGTPTSDPMLAPALEVPREIDLAALAPPAGEEEGLGAGSGEGAGEDSDGAGGEGTEEPPGEEGGQVEAPPAKKRRKA